MKKAKKMAATVLAASMLLASPVWAAGQTVLTAQEAVQEKGGATVKVLPKTELTEPQRQVLEKFYQVVPELKELSAMGISNEEEGAWGIFLTSSSLDAAPGIRNIHASLAFNTKTGELIRFDIQNPEWASEKLPSSELAKERALEFAGKVLGDKIKDYQMSDHMGYGGGSSADDKGNKIVWTTANVLYSRLFNGVPLLNSGFQVAVDAAGHITEFHKEKDDNPDPAKFPDLSRAITKEAAEKAFAGLVEIKLMYNGHQPLKLSMYGKGSDETRPVLMYYQSSLCPIDAETGKSLDDLMYNPNLKQSQRITLVGEGKKAIAKTPEEGASLLAGEFGMDMTGLKFGSVNVQDMPLDSGRKVKNFSWHSEPQRGADGKPEDSTMHYAYLRTEADTGQVLGFGAQDDSGRGKQGTVSRDAAQKTAVQFLQRYLEPGAADLEMQVISSEEMVPAWVDKSKLKDQVQQPPQFSFHFNGTYQGIPVSDRSYSVQVDALTGKVTGFSADGSASTPVTLPDSGNVVTTDAAKAEFLKHHPLRLAYIWPEFFDQKGPTPHMVYLPANYSGWGYVDALTGKTVVVEMN